MAALHVTPTTVEVELTTLEKVLGLVRDVTVPREVIVEASAHDDPMAAVRGLRAPGLAIPGRRRIGTWRRGGERALVCVSAGTPALRLRLRGHHYDEVVVSVPDAAELAAVLQPTDT